MNSQIKQILSSMSLGFILVWSSLVTAQTTGSSGSTTWQGILRATGGTRINEAVVELEEVRTGLIRRKTTAKDGLFIFEKLS